jgi:hypothetical protein
MLNRNFVGLAYVSILAVIAVQIVLAWGVYGGIDVHRYWNYSWRLDLGNVFYAKEVVSWLLIQFVGLQFDRSHFVLGICLFILAASVAGVGLGRGMLLFASFFSPFGIVLQFNVLRQGFGTVFMAAACLALVRGRLRWSVVWAALAVLSHNSAAISLAFVYGIYAFWRSSMQWRIVLALASVMLVAAIPQVSMTNELVDSRAGTLAIVMNDGLENYIYCAFALGLCALLWFTSADSGVRTVSAGLALATVAPVIPALLFSFESWLFGRLAISHVVICTFLLLDTLLPVGRPVSLGRAVAASGLVLASGSLIFFHPGALSMIRS